MSESNIDQTSKNHPWSRWSLAIFSFGILLGVVAKVFLGREFQPNDPIIGPLLQPLAFLFLISSMHVFFVIVKPYLSSPTKILCRGCFFVLTVVLGKVLILDAFL